MLFCMPDAMEGTHYVLKLLEVVLHVLELLV
jgi:hypothetical protein